MNDEILEQEMREQLREQGVDDFTVEVVLEDMRDSGMFDPDTKED